MASPSYSHSRRKPWRGERRAGVQIQPLQQLPNINTMREPPKGQVHRQKCSASPASIGFIIRPWHPSAEEEGSFCISDHPSAPVPELEECLLTTSSLYPSAVHTQRHAHTHTRTHKLICIWDVDYRGILFINLEGPVLPGLSLQSTNSPLPLSLCLPVEKISKPYLQIFLPLGPLPNAVLLRLSLFH